MGFHVKDRYYFHISMKAVFPDRFSKNNQILKSSHRGGRDISMRMTDRRTDTYVYMTKLTVAFLFLRTRLKIFHFNFNGFFLQGNC